MSRLPPEEVNTIEHNRQFASFLKSTDLKKSIQLITRCGSQWIGNVGMCPSLEAGREEWCLVDMQKSQNESEERWRPSSESAGDRKRLNWLRLQWNLEKGERGGPSTTTFYDLMWFIIRQYDCNFLLISLWLGHFKELEKGVLIREDMTNLSLDPSQWHNAHTNPKVSFRVQPNYTEHFDAEYMNKTSTTPPTRGSSFSSAQFNHQQITTYLRLVERIRPC